LVLLAFRILAPGIGPARKGEIMADETVAVARLKGLLTRIRGGLRPKDERAIQCQRDDIEEAMLCLRQLDPGLIPAGVRLGEGFRRVVCDTVGECLAKLASDRGPEYRQQLTELFGSFPESTDEADESVSYRRALLEGRTVQLSELVDDVFAAVERVYPSADPSPQGDQRGAKDDPDTPLSPAKLADRLGIPKDDSKARETLRKRLESWRKANLDGGWIEARDPKPREPRYLYPLGKVWSLIQDVKPSG